MKIAFFALVALMSCAASVRACPNFSGRYQSLDGEILTVSQIGCASISIGIQENFAQPVTQMDFIMDGGRHEIGGIFWAASWSGDKLVREPWSSILGGELLGDRNLWSLLQDGSGASIFEQVMDADDGTIMGNRVYKTIK